jgi:hypothetical protein
MPPALGFLPSRPGIFLSGLIVGDGEQTAFASGSLPAAMPQSMRDRAIAGVTADKILFEGI